MRKKIGDEYLIGDGYELGAGLAPSRFAKVESLEVIDKRNAQELEELFGAPPPYEVKTYEDAARSPKAFLTAHHVLEHCPDPIGALKEWLPLVADRGIIYLSVPSTQNVCETHREPTPIRHLLLDHLLAADGTDFESRNHIPSFVNQWAVLDEKYVWYASQGVQFYAEQMLAAQRQIEGHDLHWHTFSAEVLRQCLDVASYRAGRCADIVHEEETDTELFIVASVEDRPDRPPEVLRAFLEDLDYRISAMRSH